MGTTPDFKRRYYDLSNPVYKGMPFFPASFPVEIEQVSSTDQGRSNVHKITMSTHHGTHVDAPRHLSSSGKPLDEINLKKFIGEGVILDFTYKEIGSGVSSADLEQCEDLVKGDEIVILFTGCSNHLGDSGISANYTYLDRSGAEWLVRKKVKSVGIDIFSIDQYGNPDHPAHNLLLENGIPLIEEISSEAKHLLGKRVYLICLPIRMMMGDGAPARVIAYLLSPQTR
jgi:arylformamidase